MKRNALASLLGVDHPILLAPMAGVAGGELAGQVSDSGAFGIVGGGYGDSDFLSQQLSLLGTNKPFGVGFITWKLKEKPELLEVALARKPRAILLSFGDPEPFVETIKANGALFIAQCQSVSDAEKAAFLGADIVIAQGTEVRMVKMADRINNLQPPPEHWDNNKKRKYKKQATLIHEMLGGVNPYIEKRLKNKIREYEQYID